MRKLILALAALLLLTACTPEERIENAGTALSEISCTLLESNSSLGSMKSQLDKIPERYGFTKSSKNTLESYLKSIQGTQEQNKLSISVREKLKTRCGKLLESYNIDVNVLSQEMVTNP